MARTMDEYIADIYVEHYVPLHLLDNLERYDPEEILLSICDVPEKCMRYNILFLHSFSHTKGRKHG